MSFQTLAVGVICERKPRKKCQLGATWICKCLHSHHHATPSNPKQLGCRWAVFDAHYVVWLLAEAVGETGFQFEVRPINLRKGIWWWNQFLARNNHPKRVYRRFCVDSEFVLGHHGWSWVCPAWTCTKQDKSLLKMYAMTCATNHNTAEQNTYDSRYNLCFTHHPTQHVFVTKQALK